MADSTELINFSYHTSDFREGEHFNAFHSLGIVLSGVIELNDGQKIKQFKQGDLYSVRKNHLMRFVKYPPANGEFKSLTIFLMTIYCAVSVLNTGTKPRRSKETSAYSSFPPDKALTSFM